MPFELEEMGMTNRYIRNRMGNNEQTADAFVNRVLDRQIDNLNRRFGELSQALALRHLQANEALIELISEAEQINACEPAADQLTGLAQSIQELTQVRQALQGALLRNKEELKNQSDYLEKLRTSLREMQEHLQNAPRGNFPNEEAILEISGRLNRYISYNT